MGWEGKHERGVLGVCVERVVYLSIYISVCLHVYRLCYGVFIYSSHSRIFTTHADCTSRNHSNSNFKAVCGRKIRWDSLLVWCG